jgi:DNA-binding XRE family transcriptional regulator
VTARPDRRRPNDPRTPAIERTHQGHLNRVCTSGAADSFRQVLPKRDSNRWPLPALRELRLKAGVPLAEAARQAGISRQFLGDLERRRCRCPAAPQSRLAKLFGVGVDDLFEACDVGYEPLPPIREGWCLASEAERILGLSGEGVCMLVKSGVISRRGGRSRYQFDVNALLILVPEGSLTTKELAERLRVNTGLEVSTGFLAGERYARRLTAFQPWPGAHWRVSVENAEAYEVLLVARRRKRGEHLTPEGRARLSEGLRARQQTGGGAERLGRHIAAFSAWRKRVHEERLRLMANEDLLDPEDAAHELGVSSSTVKYYVNVDLLDAREVVIEGVTFVLFTREMLREHRRRFSNGLPAREAQGKLRDKLGIRGAHLVEENRLKELSGKGLIRTPSDEAEVKRRAAARRKAILPLADFEWGRHEKGRRAGAGALEIALEIVALRPDVNRSKFERTLVLTLWKDDRRGWSDAQRGPNPLFDESGNRRPGTDPVWRAARARALRALGRGARDAGGTPRELTSLV